MKVIHIVGARPNFMKIAPTMGALARHEGIEQRLVHTGQHNDESLSEVFLRDLDLPRPHHCLGVGSGTHAEQTARIALSLEPVITHERPDLVVVAGDANSTMAAGVTAAKADVPVVHIEAGLRSGDCSMPEEINRIVVDHLAHLLLTRPATRTAAPVFARPSLLSTGTEPRRLRQLSASVFAADAPARPGSSLRRIAVHRKSGSCCGWS